MLTASMAVWPCSYDSGGPACKPDVRGQSTQVIGLPQHHALQGQALLGRKKLLSVLPGKPPGAEDQYASDEIRQADYRPRKGMTVPGETAYVYAEADRSQNQKYASSHISPPGYSGTSEGNCYK
jgi:hypothetical protein